MKIDKKTLDMLLGLPDDKLMQMMSLITGSQHGGTAPSAESIAGLRKVLSQVTDADIARAMELATLYKQGKKG
ncbi:MAG: hypothetical protein IJ457_09905 [Clostridia bacterium]|nr:hypothetical protein [Clostridia bacterium]